MVDDDKREELSRLRLIDGEGRLVRWPTKAPQRLLVLEHLLSRVAPDQAYAEAEINEILKQSHTFGDWALLRRELVDRGYLDRDDAGRTYRVASRAASRDGRID